MGNGRISKHALPVLPNESRFSPIPETLGSMARKESPLACIMTGSSVCSDGVSIYTLEGPVMTEKVTVVVAKSIKTQLAVAIRKAMTKKKISQSDLARNMRTSRAVVHRLLKENDTSLTLATLGSALAALKLKASVRLSPAK